MLVKVLVFFLLAQFATQAAGSASKTALDKQFDQTVKPFVTKYCVSCHSGKTPAAQFDLKAYDNLEAVTKEYPRWALVAERLTAQDMPPKPMHPPPADARAGVIIDWFHAVRAEEMKRSAGDPGLCRRAGLSNAEYNYTIRDLTGHDMQSHAGVSRRSR